MGVTAPVPPLGSAFVLRLYLQKCGIVYHVQALLRLERDETP